MTTRRPTACGPHPTTAGRDRRRRAAVGDPVIGTPLRRAVENGRASAWLPRHCARGAGASGAVVRREPRHPVADPRQASGVRRPPERRSPCGIGSHRSSPARRATRSGGRRHPAPIPNRELAGRRQRPPVEVAYGEPGRGGRSQAGWKQVAAGPGWNRSALTCPAGATQAPGRVGRRSCRMPYGLRCRGPRSRAPTGPAAWSERRGHR